VFKLKTGIYCTIWGFRKDAPILSEGDEAADLGADRSVEPGMTTQAVATPHVPRNRSHAA